jgi:hypothetical protein
MVFKNTNSQEGEQHISLSDRDIGEDSAPMDEADNLLDLPAPVELVGSVDHDIVEEEYLEEPSPLPPRKRIHPARFRD